MDSEIREYDGYLVPKNPTADIKSQIVALRNETGLSLRIIGDGIELQSIGRDSDRWIEGVLIRVAAIIKDAEGEIECRSANEDGDDWFEFYSVSEGRLFKQEAKIVRSAKYELIPRHDPE